MFGKLLPYGSTVNGQTAALSVASLPFDSMAGGADSSSKLPRAVPRPATDKALSAFGLRMKAAIDHAGTTQTALERRLNLSRGRLSKLSYATPDKIDFVVVEAIADACGVDFHWLARARGNMLPARTPAPVISHDLTPAPPSAVRTAPPSRPGRSSR